MDTEPTPRRERVRLNEPEESGAPGEVNETATPKRKWWRAPKLEVVMERAWREGTDDGPASIHPSDAPDDVDDPCRIQEVGPDDEEELKDAQHEWDSKTLEDDEWCKFRGKVIPRHVAEHAAVVWQSAKSSVHARIKTGKALLKMKEQVGHGHFQQAFTAAVMPYAFRSAEELMKIAKDPVLSNPRNSAFLPVKREPTVRLSRLRVPDEVKQELVDNGTIHPAMTIAEVEGLHVLKLPALIQDLVSIAEKHTPETAAKHVGSQLVDKFKGATLIKINELVSWITTFGEVFAQATEEYREQSRQQEVFDRQVNNDKKIRAATLKHARLRRLKETPKYNKGRQRIY